MSCPHVDDIVLLKSPFYCLLLNYAWLLLDISVNRANFTGYLRTYFVCPCDCSRLDNIASPWTYLIVALITVLTHQSGNYYPAMRSMRRIQSLLFVFLFVCMYGYGFLSRGFTDRREILRRGSA